MLLILCRQTPGIALALRHSHHLGLYLSCLHVFLHLIIRCCDEESVGPPLVGDAHFYLSQEREIVVVEAATVSLHVCSRLFVPHFNVLHHVVVLRITQPEAGTYHQSVLHYILPREVCPVGVERPDAVGGVEIVDFLPVRHDVHCSAQRVGAEPCGHHTLVNLNMIDHVDRQIGQRDVASFCVQRHTVEEVSHGVARHAVDAQVEVGAHTTLFTYLHASRAVDNAVQTRQSVHHRTHVDGIHG